MAGRATLTTVPSTKARLEPRTDAASTQRFCAALHRRRHRREQACPQRDDVGGPRPAVQRRQLAERGAGLQVAEARLAPTRRVGRDPYGAGHDQVQATVVVLTGDQHLPRFEAAPRALARDLVEALHRKSLQQLHAAQSEAGWCRRGGHGVAPIPPA
jgi:hypothetical protein